jgi:hypothetical protein
VRSYISNSNSRKPKINYFIFWSIFISLLLSALIFSEFHWRRAGFKHNITDSQWYWAAHRNTVYNDGNNNKKLVIVGASRSQVGIVPDVLESELKLKAVHLAIDGIDSLYVLKDLSEDSSFEGIIIFSMTIGALDPENLEKAKPWVDFYHNNFNKPIDYSSKFDSFLKAKLQQHFVMMSSALSLKRIIYSGLSPKLLYLHMQVNRYRPAYYRERITEKELITYRKNRIQFLNNRKWMSMSDEIFKDVLMNRLRKYYNDLKKHNAKLLIIRMPTTDEHWIHDQSIYPKDKYWDQINTLTGIPTIHFKDYNQLSSFDCPDTSHLDAKDSPLFTRNLSQIVRELLEDL